MSERPPTCIVLAGINGAGKTTSSRTLLADTFDVLTFVNADIIAQGLSGFAPDDVALEAGRIMLDRLHTLGEKRADFAFETTMAGRTYASLLRSLRDGGYHIDLYYFWLKSADLAIERVAARVRSGGHHVPDATVRQRYTRSVRNLFTLYMPIVTEWRVYDNSEQGMPRLVAEGGPAGPSHIYEPENWELIRQGAS